MSKFRILIGEEDGENTNQTEKVQTPFLPMCFGGSAELFS